jgi:hypothetical protein
MQMFAEIEKPSIHPKSLPSIANSILDLGGDLRLRVRDLDRQLLRTGNDINSLSRRDVVGNPVILSIPSSIPDHSVYRFYAK